MACSLGGGNNGCAIELISSRMICGSLAVSRGQEQDRAGDETMAGRAVARRGMQPDEANR